MENLFILLFKPKVTAYTYSFLLTGVILNKTISGPSLKSKQKSQNVSFERTGREPKLKHAYPDYLSLCSLIIECIAQFVCGGPHSFLLQFAPLKRDHQKTSGL